MKRKYLVTGVAGFIGRFLAKSLLEEGETVVGIDNFATGKRHNLEGLNDLEFFEGDICDPDLMARACVGVDVILHQAALASVPRSIANPIASNHANVNGTLQVLEAARNAKVRRVVFAASSSVYGDTPTLPKREDMIPNPLSPYAASKAAGEFYLRSYHRVYGLETVALRYFNVFGPHQDPNSQYSGVLARFISQMLRGFPPTVFGDGEQSRDFTFIENVVNANLLASRAPAESVAGRVFNVATGRRVSLNETIDILRQLTRYEGPVSYGPTRSGDVKHSLADVSAAQAAFGYEPRVHFQQGLERTVAWYNEEKTL